MLNKTLLITLAVVAGMNGTVGANIFLAIGCVAYLIVGWLRLKGSKSAC